MDLAEAKERINEKINAPKRQSAWARDKQAAEAKKREDEAANAALLKSFEQSFDFDSTQDARSQQSGRGQAGGSRESGQARNHGFNNAPRSGPGSLGPSYDRSGPTDRKKRRAIEEARMLEDERRGQRTYDQRHLRPEQSRESREQEHGEQEHDEPTVPKPCIHLSSLPPGMTAEQLKAILSPHLTVGPVRFHASAGLRSDCKKSISATAWLATDTTTKQIDDAVTALRDRYVGCGFVMKSSRIAVNPNLHPNINGSGAEEPFGAQRVQVYNSLKNAPPPEERGRFAPPNTYDRRGPASRENEVNIDRCLDLPTTRLVHTIADRLLAQQDAERALEMEALLMSLPEVQTDPRFSFLFDSRSLAGIYYRYCLWSDPSNQAPETEQIFDDVRAKWRPPAKRMPYSKLTDLSYAVKDVDYLSSDEESDDEQKQATVYESVDDLDAISHVSITPLQRARLTHLLARLPTVNSKLRRGDLARVTNFAISNAAIGIDEIVDMLLLNVELPFSLSLAAKYEQTEDASFAPTPQADDDDEYDPEKPSSIDEEPRSDISNTQDTALPRETDPSSAKLVALYAISDILHAIASSEGAKNAWKYRQLFEHGFKNQKTFERLATLERQYGWGKMKAEQWKRKIGVLFDLWENSSAFPGDVVKALRISFYPDPKERAITMASLTEPPKDESEVKKPLWIRQLQNMDTDSSKPSVSKKGPTLLDPESLQFVRKSDEDRKKQHVDTALLAGIADDTIEVGEDVKMDDVQTDVNGEEASQPPAEAPSDELPPDFSTANKPTPMPKKRMRAEDMFADSDED